MEVFVVFDTMGGGRVLGVYDSRELAEAVKKRDPHYLRIEVRTMNAVDEELLSWGRVDHGHNGRPGTRDLGTILEPGYEPGLVHGHNGRPGTRDLGTILEPGYEPGLVHGQPEHPVPKDSEPKDLHTASFFGDALRIEELLTAGADVNEQRDGLTALHLAVAGGRPAVMIRLLLAGADPDPESWIEEPNPEPLWSLIDRRSRRRFYGSLGMTPLHLACERGSPQLVRLLLERGADARLFVLLDSGEEGAFAWTPKELSCPPREAVSETRQQIAALIERHLAHQPQTERSRARQEKRVQAAW
jgi:hypothetical protein